MEGTVNKSMRDAACFFLLLWMCPFADLGTSLLYIQYLKR